MGKEFSLAWTKEEGQSVLLAITSSGERITESSVGNKRTQKPEPFARSEGEKIKNTEAKGKGSRKTERANASSSKKARRGRDNKNRKPNRGDERRDKSVRRSAQELGITFPGSYCDELKTTPHHWNEVEKTNDGSLYQCKFCHKHLWLPTSEYGASQLGAMMKQYGQNEGYCRYLNKHRPAKILMAKLQDLSRLEGQISDKRKFAKLTDKILSAKDYDIRKEVHNG